MIGRIGRRVYYTGVFAAKGRGTLIEESFSSPSFPRRSFLGGGCVGAPEWLRGGDS